MLTRLSRLFRRSAPVVLGVAVASGAYLGHVPQFQAIVLPEPQVIVLPEPAAPAFASLADLLAFRQGARARV